MLYVESKKKLYKLTYLQNRNRLTDLKEKELMVPRGDKGREGPRQKPTPAPRRPCLPRPCTVQVPSQLLAFTPG